MAVRNSAGKAQGVAVKRPEQSCQKRLFLDLTPRYIADPPSDEMVAWVKKYVLPRSNKKEVKP